MKSPDQTRQEDGELIFPFLISVRLSTRNKFDIFVQLFFGIIEAFTVWKTDKVSDWGLL